MFSFFKKQRTQNQRLDEISRKILATNKSFFDLVDGTFANLKETGVPLEKEPAKKYLIEYFGLTGGPRFNSTDSIYDYIIKLWCLKKGIDCDPIIIDGIVPVGHPIWNSIQRGEGVPAAFELYDEVSDSRIEESFLSSFGFPLQIPSKFILWRETCTVRDANALNKYSKVQLEVKITRKIVNQDEFYKMVDDKLGW